MNIPARLARPGWKVLGAIALVTLLALTPWLARGALSRLAFFNIRTVDIRGVRYLQPGDVVARLRIDTLRSLWDDLDPLRERLRGHPQISSVTLSRKLPSTLVVVIDENLPIALVPTASGLQPYDSLGRALPIDPSTADLDVPIVPARDPVLLRLLGAVRADQPRLFARVSEMRRAGAREIVMQLHDGPLRVRIPVGVPARRLADIFPVESDLARRFHGSLAPVAELDLRYRDQVIARLQ